MKSGPDVFLSVCSTLEISSQSIPLDLLDRDSDFHVSMTLSVFDLDRGRGSWCLFPVSESLALLGAMTDCYGAGVKQLTKNRAMGVGRKCLANYSLHFCPTVP